MVDSNKPFFVDSTDTKEEPKPTAGSDTEYDFGSFQDLLSRVIRYIHIILIILFVHLPKAMLLIVTLVVMCDPTVPNFVLLVQFIVTLWKGVRFYPRWVTSYRLCFLPLCCQIFLVSVPPPSLMSSYAAQFSFMATIVPKWKPFFASLGMTKWTPSIDHYPDVGSPEWTAFTSNIWYGELEFFFTTMGGLVLSVFMYFGRTAEENDNAEVVQEDAKSQFHIEVNAIHRQFILHTFPQLLKPRREQEKSRMKDVEEYYRVKHTERMWVSVEEMMCRTQMTTGRSDSFYRTLQQIKANGASQSKPNAASPSVLRTPRTLSPSSPLSPFDLDLIPDAPTPRLPSHPLAFSFTPTPQEASTEVLSESLEESVLDNSTILFRTKGSQTEVQTPESPPTVLPEEKDANYIQEIEETITQTWLVVYSVIIRVMDFLVTVSLSYERHALSLLRACSIIALVVCCMR